MLSRHEFVLLVVVSLFLPSIISYASDTSATVPPACPPLALSVPPYQSWNDDTAYEIQVSNVSNGKLRVVITGDILSLDDQNFSSILRSASNAPANISELILDGREVRIKGPLSLQHGNVRIFAQRVSFEAGGRIVLTHPPENDKDGLDINAEAIDLRKADSLPFQVVVQYGDLRYVSIKAGSVLFPEKLNSQISASEGLWRLSSNFNGYLPAAYPSSWKINVGEAGQESAIKVMQAQADWPTYFAYKLHKFQAYAPYDVNNQQTILKLINKLSPLIIQLERADVLLDLNGISQLIKNNTDNRGYGPGLVPSEDFITAKDRFDKALQSADLTFRNLISLVISTRDNYQDSAALLNQARGRIKALNESQERLALAVGQSVTRLGELQSSASVASGIVAEEHENSLKRLEELKQKDKDLANIKSVTTVVAIGASVVGSPAVGAAIATTVSTAGDMIYAHNAGKTLDLATIINITQKNGELFKKVSQVRNAWDKHSADLVVLKSTFDSKPPPGDDNRKSLTRTEAANKAGASAGEFADAVRQMVESLGSIPQPDAVSLNQVEAENGALQSALYNLSAIQNDIAKQVQQLESLQAALTTDEASLAEAKLVENVLLNVSPENDADKMRWRAAAFQLWTRELRRLYQQAMDLRRSLYYQTWKTPVLPEELQSYPEEISACLDAGRCSLSSLNGLSDQNTVRQNLENETSRHLALMSGIAGAIDDAWQSYQAERASGAQPFFDQQDISSSNGSPESQITMLEQLNAQIRRQIAFPASRDQTPFRILIPLTMVAPPQAGLPERLVKAGVANPVFKNPDALKGKSIMFNITWPLAGEVINDGQCSWVNLSIPRGNQDKTVRDLATDPVSMLKAQSDEPLTLDILRKSRTAPPARTLFFLSVTVGGDPQNSNWKTIPELEGFTFWRSIVQ
jgi:hypothetical protein